ncbi:hypothetical protein C0J52_07518 [Blattella germanica]|nr:hypothetical protein C0J52_07518 [Blattella germanica]
MAKEMKISFSFTKTSKQNTAFKQNVQKKETVQYIDCLDSKAIICKKNEDEEKEETATDLVIPLKSTKVQKSEETSSSKESSSIDESSSTECSTQETLEDKAVKEILNDVNKPTDEKDNSMLFKYVINMKPQTKETKEPTLDDYEQIPIHSYGMAMLRGMGWKPGEGSGNTERVTATETPIVRPRGMGLGADKHQASTENAESSKEEKLEIVKGAFIQMLSGSRRGQYGQIQGFDDEAGRVIVKLAMEGSPVSLSEHALKLVSKKEYEKNSRVLNVTKYEEYKQKNGHSDAIKMEQDKDTSSDEESITKRRNRSRTPTKKRNRGSSSPEENERKGSTFTQRIKHESKEERVRHRSQVPTKQSKYKRN